MKKPTILVIVAIIVMVLIQAYVFSDFKQLPSPVFGGDVYYHFGVVNHIYNGESPIMNSQLLGEYAHYPWLLHLIVAIIGWIIPLGIMTITIYFPLLVTILTGIIAYLLGKKLFEDDWMAALFSIAMMTIMVPMLAASPFAALIIFPLFILSTFKIDTPLGMFLCGICFGLTALAHVITFVAGGMFLFFLFIIKLFKIEKGKLKYNKSILGKTLISFFVILLIGIGIAMLYWGTLIFNYHGATPNRWSSYVASGEIPSAMDIINKVKDVFFNLSSIPNFMYSLFCILGFYFTIVKKKTIPLLLIAIAFIGYIHPIITVPLLGTSVGSYGFDIVFMLVKPILLIFGLIFVRQYLIKMPKVDVVITTLSISFLIVLGAITLNTFDNDQWTQTARTPNFLYATGVDKLIVNNVKADEVILSPHEESGFVINAMTGKKVMIARRTHTSPFVDMNKRVTDAAIILYGNNTQLRNQLIKKYNVKYLYEDFYSEQSKLQCNNNSIGDLSFNCLRTTPMYDTYLAENGIKFIRVNSRLDPASAVAPTFDLLAIMPINYTLPLVIKQEVRQGEQTIVRISEVIQ